MTLPQLVVLLDELKKIGTPATFSVAGDPCSFAVQRSKGAWEEAVHLKVLSDWLLDLEAGRKKRVLVSMPPRHGKSELISYWFPLWLLARNPSRRIILASYEAEFAAHWGRRVRNAIIDFGSDLGLTLDGTSAAAHRWQLTAGGGMFTAGAGGPLTGRGADVLIIDDPIKNSEEASSEVLRENLWNWFQTTAYSRLEPGGYVVIVGTRWHQDDLIGRLEAEAASGAGLPWDVLKLPALAEAEDFIGRELEEPLWKVRYDKPALLDIKRNMSPFNWSALYQQRPTPEEGGAIKRAWWKFYEVPPAELDNTIQSWDLAFKDLKTSDFTVGQVWGRKGAEFYLLHQVRDRMNSPEVISAIRNLTRMYPKAIAKVIEDSASGPSVIQMLQKEVTGLIPWPPRGQKRSSKDQRLNAVAPYIQAGNVYLPGLRRPDGAMVPAAPWVSEFIEECASFPNGTNDDQLDAMTQGLIYLSPASWLAISQAHREAKIGPPPKTTVEILNQAFSKTVKKHLKLSEKRANEDKTSIFRPRRVRAW